MKNDLGFVSTVALRPMTAVIGGMRGIPLWGPIQRSVSAHTLREVSRD